MKKSEKTFLSLIIMLLSASVIFADKKGTFTILHDEATDLITDDSIIYSGSYANTVYELTKITREDMHRKRIPTIPKELERFYGYGMNLVNVMSVDSKEGLRVRSEPSPRARRICVLPNDCNVIVCSLGAEEKIDGIKSAWVEILLPQYLWSGDDPEFGWVFGGYLKDMSSHQFFSLACDDDYYYDEYDGIPFGSPHLHDVIDGTSYFDRCSYRMYDLRIRGIDKYFGNREQYYEYEIELGLEKLKLIQAGVIPNKPYNSIGFDIFWDKVQEMRQIHPAKSSSHFGSELNQSNSIYTDDTVKLNKKKTLLTYTSPLNGETYNATIPSDYSSDFLIYPYSSEKIEIQSYEPEGADLPGPLIQMLKISYDNKAIYHYEVFYYTIVDGCLVKFLQIITVPDFLEEYTYGSYFMDDEERSELYICAYYNSIIYDMMHDDIISIKRCPEYPYIQVSKDDCHNYNMIQEGATYKEWED